MIYAPDLSRHPLSSSPAPLARSISSSYSNIDHEDADEEKQMSVLDPKPIASPPRPSKFDALYNEAKAVVDAETMIMPFTSRSSYVQLLRHIVPDVVYVQAPLAGPNGESAKQVSNWVGQVVLVVGDETGHGGLVDSEDEAEHDLSIGDDGWWKKDPKVGLGKGIEVVDGSRIGEDWRRRVRGHD